MAHYQETKEIQSLMADQLGITSNTCSQIKTCI